MTPEAVVYESSHVLKRLHPRISHARIADEDVQPLSYDLADLLRRHQDAVAAGDWHQQPLVTLGDAMSSFLSHADATTSGYALLEREDCANGALKAIGEKSLDQAESRMNRLRHHKQFFQGASKTQWLFVIIS